MDRDRPEFDMLDERDHCWPVAAFGVPQPGPRCTDCRRNRQIAKASDSPIALDHGPVGRDRFLLPRIERIRDALRAPSLLGLALAFQFGGVVRAGRTITVEQPEPTQ